MQLAKPASLRHKTSSNIFNFLHHPKQLFVICRNSPEPLCRARGLSNGSKQRPDQNAQIVTFTLTNWSVEAM